MLSVIMLSVVILNVIMLSITYKPFMLSVVMLSVVMLSVIMLNVIMLECRYAECRYAECHGAQERGHFWINEATDVTNVLMPSFHRHTIINTEHTKKQIKLSCLAVGFTFVVKFDAKMLEIHRYL